MGEEIDFHTKRAIAEIDLARRAKCYTAAQAHLQLSSLHLGRVRQCLDLEGSAE